MNKTSTPPSVQHASGLTLISILVSISISSILFMAIAQLFSLASISINTTISLNSMSNEMAKAIQALDSHVGDMAGLLMPNVNTIPEKNIPTSVFVTQRGTDPNHTLYAIFRNPNFKDLDPKLELDQGDDVVLKRSGGLIGFDNPTSGTSISLAPHNSPEISTCDGRILDAGNVGINQFNIDGDRLICTAYHIPRADYSQYIDTDLASANDFNPKPIPNSVGGPSITVANGIIGFKVLLRLTSGPLGFGVNTYFDPTAQTPFWPSVRGITVGLILQGNPVPGQVQRPTSIFTQYGDTTMLGSTQLPGRRDNAMLSRIERTISLKSAYIPGYTYSSAFYLIPTAVTSNFKIKNSRYKMPASGRFGGSSPSNSLLCLNSSGAPIQVTGNFGNGAILQETLLQSYFSGPGNSTRTGPPNWLMLPLNTDLFDTGQLGWPSRHTVDIKTPGLSNPSGFFINDKPISFRINEGDSYFNVARIRIQTAIKTALPDYRVEFCGYNICMQPPGGGSVGKITLKSNGSGVTCSAGTPDNLCAPFFPKSYWGSSSPLGGGPQQLIKQFGYAPPGQTINLIKDGNNPFRINSIFKIDVTQIKASGLGEPLIIQTITIPQGTYAHLNELATHINTNSTFVMASVMDSVIGRDQVLRITPRLSYHGLYIRSDGTNLEPVFNLNYPLNTRTKQIAKTYGQAYNGSSNVPWPCYNEGQSLWLY